VLGEAQPLAADQQGLVPLRCNLAAPAALYRNELDEVRGGRSTALDLVDMHDIEPIAGARIIFGPQHRIHRRPQCQPPDAAHGVDA